MAKRLSGKEVAAALNEKTRAKVENLKAQGIQPTLGIIRAGADKSDLSYEKGIVHSCQSLAIVCEKLILPADASKEELLSAVEKMNRADHIHGALLFRPLPKHLQQNQAVIENALLPVKDVDGMTDVSMSSVFTGKTEGFPPCTPQACMEIVDYYGINCKGKKAVVIGRSLVAGKPAAMLLLRKDATVTICHTKTEDMASVVRKADIVIAAVGRAGLIDDAYLSPGQVVIDVGIHVDKEGKLCGDVDYAKAEPIVGAITPVPGGVGSVTTSVLMSHVAEAALQKGEKI